MQNHSRTFWKNTSISLYFFKLTVITTSLFNTSPNLGQGNKKWEVVFGEYRRLIQDGFLRMHFFLVTGFGWSLSCIFPYLYGISNTIDESFLPLPAIYIIQTASANRDVRDDFFRFYDKWLDEIALIASRQKES